MTFNTKEKKLITTALNVLESDYRNHTHPDYYDLEFFDEIVKLREKIKKPLVEKNMNIDTNELRKR